MQSVCEVLGPPLKDDKSRAFAPTARCVPTVPGILKRTMAFLDPTEKDVVGAQQSSSVGLRRESPALQKSASKKTTHLKNAWRMPCLQAERAQLRMIGKNKYCPGANYTDDC